MPLKIHRWVPAGIIWLFHLTAIIGIALGHEDWFIKKTPLNLAIAFVVLVWCFPLDRPFKWGWFLLISTLGLTAEWIGVHTGVPFGNYAYGENFGPKVGGVPWLIGLFWGVLSMITYSIAQRLMPDRAINPILAAALMLLLDVLMERSAPRFDFWSFQGEPPFENFISWFALGLVFQGLLGISRIKGDFFISVHLFLAQLVFFAYFALF